MSAVTFAEVLLAVEKGGAEGHVKTLLSELLVADIPTQPFPALRAISKGLRDDYKGAKAGALIIAVFHARTPDIIERWAKAVASCTIDPLELYGDAFLALSEYVIAWNRSHLRAIVNG